MAYEKLNLSTGTTFKADHLAHIEEGIYKLSMTNDARLVLPDKIRWEVGKPLYIFKHAITTAFNYENYNIQVIASNNPDGTNNTSKLGKDTHRYFTYTAKSAETITLTFRLYDAAHNLLDTKAVTLEIVASKLPTSTTTVLFIGDSLTYYNRITDEFSRIMTSSDAESSDIQDTISIYKLYKPAGRGSDKVSLIGTQLQNFKGWTGKQKHEGWSGKDWSWFCGTSSPFYVNSTKLNFTGYLSKNGFTTPDVIYIGLGWNDTRQIAIREDGVIDTTSIYNSAKTFLTALTTQLPNAKIRLWTQNVPGTRGGIGNHPYGATLWSDEHRLKLMQFAIAEMYKTLAAEFSNVELVWATAMIDSEYALQESDTAINYRIKETEVTGVDYVHPADAGFFQITDAIVSDFMHCIV